MRIYEEVIQFITERRERVLSGKLNCLPVDLPRFGEHFQLEKSKYYIVTANHKVGKCFGKGTEVILYDGSIKKVEDITSCDILLGPDSTPRKVAGVTKGHSMLYKITQKYGESFIVNAKHILYLAKVTANSYSTYKEVSTSKRPRKYEYVVMTVKEFLSLTPAQQQKYRMVQSNEVDFNNTPNLDIPPYLYGLWLGDGDSVGPTITNTDEEVISYLYNYAHQHGLVVNKYGNIRYALKTLPVLQAMDADTNHITLYSQIPTTNKEACYISRATKTGQIVLNQRWKWLSKKGDFYTRFIKVTGSTKNIINPAYLQSSKTNRYELLAGLIDSDGYKIPNKNAYEITLKQESLIKDIQFLARSLGFRAYYTPKNVNNVTYYKLRIVGSNCYKIPIKVTRKRTKENPTVYINELCRRFTIEEVGVGDYYGFTVDKDHLFLLKDYTIVHNTQITDWLFMYVPLLFAYKNKDKVKLKIKYFTWEMSSREKYLQAIAFLIYTLSNGKYRIEPKVLASVNSKKPLPELILNLLKTDEYKQLLEFIEEHVEFIDDIRNPTGIKIFLENFAKANGTVHKINKKFKNNTTGEETDVEVFGHFTPNDPEEHWIAIFDHISLVTPEKGMDLRETIGKLSANVIVPLKRYGFTLAAVQQQAQAQESLEHFKANRIKPSADGLGDNKTTARDCDVCLGLYGPYRYGIREYEGYDITQLKDNIRFLEIIAGRQGGAGNICPLYFDGAVNFFKELPRPDNAQEMYKVYALINSLNRVSNILFNLITISKNESIDTRPKWVRQIHFYWRSARTRFKRIKPERNILNKLCK